MICLSRWSRISWFFDHFRTFLNLYVSKTHQILTQISFIYVSIFWKRKLSISSWMSRYQVSNTAKTVFSLFFTQNEIFWKILKIVQLQYISRWLYQIFRSQLNLHQNLEIRFLEVNSGYISSNNIFFDFFFM